MNDFQEQAKNWLRNVVKQNPGKIKAGVEKAGDLIDKQTGGKYAEKVDAVQQKVGTYVDSQSTENSDPAQEPTGRQSSDAQATGSAAGASGPEAETGPDDGAPDAAGQAGSSSQAGSESGNAESDNAESDKVGSNTAEGGVPMPGGAASEASGGVVGGDAPDPASEPTSSAGSRPEGIQTGGTVTGRGEPSKHSSE
jgi:hypothetical protein